jgi:hypothetical protein
MILRSDCRRIRLREQRIDLESRCLEPTVEPKRSMLKVSFVGAAAVLRDLSTAEQKPASVAE